MKYLKPQNEESHVSYCPFRRKKLNFALKYCFFFSNRKFTEISKELSYVVFSHLVHGDLWCNNWTRNWREHVCSAGAAIVSPVLKNSFPCFLGTQQLKRERESLGAGVIWEQGKTPSPKPQSRLSINFILMPRSTAEVRAFVLSSPRALCSICSRSQEFTTTPPLWRKRICVCVYCPQPS